MMKRRYLAGLLLIAILFVLLALIWWRSPVRAPLVVGGELPGPCRNLDFEAVPYIVCEIDPRGYDVAVYLKGNDGKAFGSLGIFDKAMAEQGSRILLAMNAGMYHDDLTPVGLLVENGQE